MASRLFSPPHLRRSFVIHVLAIVALAAMLAVPAAAAPTIRFRGNGLDRFKFHGRVPLEPPSLGGPIDPLTTGFEVDLINGFGFIYRAILLPGDLQPRGNYSYAFRDNGALDGTGTRGGVYQVITRFREFAHGWYYTVRILAFADLSSATEPVMTVVFNEMDGSFAVTAEWTPTDYGWRMPISEF